MKAGYNLSNMKWKFDNFDDYKFNSKSYFYVGAIAEHYLSNKISLQGELLFTQLGGQTSEDVVDIVGNEVVELGTATTKIITTQLQLPISVKYYFIPNFSLSGGVNFGFNLSSKSKSNFNYSGAYNGSIDTFKTLNIFPFLGAEYKFNNRIFTDARYNFGAFNTAVSGAPDTRIGFFQIGLGYRFK